MFVTAREKAIIETIIKTSGKHTAHSIADHLHVSVRTVQRDLKNIEHLLERFELELVKTNEKGFSISGKDERIFRLIQTLVMVKPIDLSAEERKLLILLQLMDSHDSLKLAPLAGDLGISVTTLVAYLDELASWLSAYGMKLTRKKGVGVELLATEEACRKALANFYLLYFNEDLIETLFSLAEQNQEGEGLVLHYFKPGYLRKADQWLSEVNAGLTRLADNDYMGLLIHLCLTMQRNESGFFLPEKEMDQYAKEFEEYRLAEEIGRRVKDELGIPMHSSDFGYLALLWRGSKVQGAENLYYDSVTIGRSLKKIIQHVSQQLNVDLTSDFSLFQGLLAHMEPSLFRIGQGLSSFNPLTEDIKRKYPVLFMAVKQALEQEFADIVFPEEETAYIVLHFGSALELRKETVPITALVVCPTGIGTSKMLASRIKKEIPEITSVQISSLKELQETDHEAFDIVISTVRLPLIHQEYVLVNPLLRDEDIQSIRIQLGESIQQLTKSHQYTAQPDAEKEEPARELPSLQTMLQDMEDTQTSMKSILQNLQVTDSEGGSDYQSILLKMAKRCKEDGLIGDVRGVYEQLLQREKQAGLGIPGTSMALFHCRHESIKEMVFRIAHLGKPCTLMGMDRREMKARNILLLLAPDEMREKQLEILSMVSTAIVESAENMLVFSSSNEQMIRRKLEETFYSFLQNNLVKE
ncbi:BglG family transcription antiterminator [Metabacillus sp. GX 13764]|uniref:BglG family transcription antiterminator n=1 Tax=Metabacillus kandeliae TaxID=2900151 RepID=UPI001E4355EA|nr:BglG family transcription antiterminator [Metabacillus kandeliae]MCD7036030.1 BglG family transcription antiterminator [Metabacillus kandeliae]